MKEEIFFFYHQRFLSNNWIQMQIKGSPKIYNWQFWKVIEKISNIMTDKNLMPSNSSNEQNQDRQTDRKRTI